MTSKSQDSSLPARGDPERPSKLTIADSDGRLRKALATAAHADSLRISNSRPPAFGSIWYLNSTWKPETRDVKVRQLLGTAERKDIAIDIQDPGLTRRMALLKEGDGIRIAPGTAVIHGVDGYGIHQTFDPSYELVAEVDEGRISTHRERRHGGFRGMGSKLSRLNGRAIGASLHLSAY